MQTSQQLIGEGKPCRRHGCDASIPLPQSLLRRQAKSVLHVTPDDVRRWP